MNRPRIDVLGLAVWGLFAFWLVCCFVVARLAAQTPRATEADRTSAQLAISTDGRIVTVRGPARDELRVCVEPRLGEFGPTRCFTVGQIRRGEVKAQ